MCLACLVRFLSRGERRKRAILELLAENPRREFSEADICEAIVSWMGVVRPDLLTLHQRGKVTRRMDEDWRFYYRIKTPQREGA